jgi:Ser/Thr protein kinase RdoA (MazF antagonist)
MVMTVLLDMGTERANALAELLARLEEHDFPTNRLVRGASDRHGGEGQPHPVLVKRWLPGEVVSHMGPQDREEVGRQLAKLHQIPPPPRMPSPCLFGLDKIQALEDATPRPGDLDALLGRLQGIEIPGDLPTGIGHGDLFMDNLIRGPQGLSLIDFEASALMRHGEDLGMALVGLCSPRGAPDKDAAQALLRGYDSARSRSPAERAALGAEYRRAALACGLWRLWQYRVNSPSEERCDAHRAMLDLADRIEGLPGDYFQ